MSRKKTFSTILITLICFLFISQSNILAQRVVQVPQGVGTLNEAIDSDTTATGERVDLNTVYELTLGGYYVLTGSLENSGYHLQIVAEEGDGVRPILRPGVTDGESSRAIRARGDLTLKGIYVTNLDEQNGLNKNLIRASEDDITITIDDCHLDFESQSVIRVDNPGMRIYITNSIISNVGTMASPDNGRGVDDRGNDIDVLVMENNTFYNLTSRILRDGGGLINECKINHNTLVNIAQRGVSIGEAIDVEFMNNLVIDAGFLGTTDSETEVFEIDPLGDDLISAGTVQKVMIKNNNFFVHSELIDAQPDSIMPLYTFDSLSTVIMEMNGTSGTNLVENVTFTTAPTVDPTVVTSSWDPSVDPKVEMDNGGGGPTFGGTQMPFDFAYNTDAASYVAGMYRQPLGDLNYFDLDLITEADVRVVQVPQGVGTLNEAIDGDTTATGERVDLNTVYELTLGGYYVLTGSLENSGYHLQIVAEEGDGVRPILRPGVTDGESSRAIRARGDLTLKGIYVTNLDEQNGLNKNLIRASEDDITITIDDCHLDFESQSVIRVDNPGMRIYITNSIISNVGTMASPDNGRGVDDRGNDIDVLVMENNTFYNLTSRILRDGGGLINFARINHNTLVNIAQRGCTFGEVIDGEFTNNILIDAGFLGTTDGSDLEVIEVSPLGQDLIDAGIMQKLKISNNNIFVHSTLTDVYPDSVIAVPFYDSLATLVMDAGTSINEELTFTTAPMVDPTVVTSSWDPAVDPKVEMDNGGGGPTFGGTQMPFDFAFNTDAQSYTLGVNGLPLGNLNNFDVITDVELFDNNLPSDYTLSNNYPNPFNPSTNIQYSIPKNELVSLVVYNLLGQKVITLVNSELGAGNYNIVWNGKNEFGNKVASGIYIYQLTAGQFIQSKKMILMK